jgi:hypothetical protein
MTLDYKPMIPAPETVLLRVWRDYWVQQEGAPWNPSEIRVALSLMVRQFDAFLAARERGESA